MKNSKIRFFIWLTGILFLLFTIEACWDRNHHSRSSSSRYFDVEDSYGYCGYDDGSYYATVDYHNPDTDYYAVYELMVEVSDCEVIIIYFPKGGWLDEDYIIPAELDEDGYCIVYGEDGKRYEVQLD